MRAGVGNFDHTPTLNLPDSSVAPSFLSPIIGHRQTANTPILQGNFIDHNHGGGRVFVQHPDKQIGDARDEFRFLLSGRAFALQSTFAGDSGVRGRLPFIQDLPVFGKRQYPVILWHRAHILGLGMEHGGEHGAIGPVAHPDYGPACSRKRLGNAEMRPYMQVVVAGTGKGKYDQSRDVVPDGLRWTVSDFAAKKEIVVAGMGWGGMPEHLITEELESGVLVPLNLEGYPIRRSQLHVIRRREGALGVVANALWEGLAQ